MAEEGGFGFDKMVSLLIFLPFIPLHTRQAVIPLGSQT